MTNTCLSSNINFETAKVINFPNNYMPIRLAQTTDIKAIIELWANSATMRYFFDPVRWNWKNRASEFWADYANDLIEDEKKFLLICDLQDNGLSGFLVAKLEELPNYYQNQYSLSIEEFYLRPKDKKLPIFNEMIEVLLREARLRVENNFGISLKLEILESDAALEALLSQAGLKKSSITYTVDY